MEERNPIEAKKVRNDIMGEAFSGKNDYFSHKEIVDTFFKKSIPAAPQKKKSKGHKQILLFLALTSILALALFLIIIILSYKLKILAPNTVITTESKSYSENIIKNGQIDRSNIEEIYFDGDAKEESSFLKNSIRLVNSGKEGRAALVMRFREPADLDGKNVLIVAKAWRGVKKINLVLKDGRDRFYEFPNVLFLSSWGIKHIYLDKRDDFDLKEIKELKLEFGSFTAGNAENSTLYLKDLTIRGAL